MRKMFGRVPRIVWIVLLGIVLVLCAGGVGALIQVATRTWSKGGAMRSPELPQPTPAEPIAIPQLESHTCGLLSLSAAYEAYGMSPVGKNLRYRLGVDVNAVPFDSASTGTLHPDLLRVMVQDGLVYEMVDPHAAGTGDRIARHLADQQLALVLIRRRQTGGLHWVLADRIEDERVRVLDSLESEPVYEELKTYLGEQVLSVILMRPATDTESPESVSRAHRDGMEELVRIRERLKRVR